MPIGPFENCATELEVRSLYRKLSQLLHPDMPTGDKDDFDQLVKHRDKRLEQIARQVCEMCLGTRRVQQRRGFSAITVPCPNCNGT